MRPGPSLFVKVAFGGSTLIVPPQPWTMYHQFDELSVDAFQASEMLSGPDAVMRRFVGVVGAVRSRAGPAADAALKINETARMIPAKPVRLTDMRLLPRKLTYPG